MAHTPQAEYQDSVIYARYSSDTQCNASIEQQIQSCKKFADRLGLRIVQTYKDRAITSTDGKQLGFQQMIKDAKTSQWKYIIVQNFNLFSEDRYVATASKIQFQSMGIKVLSVEEETDNSVLEPLMESMFEFFSQK